MINNQSFSYALSIGRLISNRYEVLQFLGSGWEGEVYKVMELSTGVERAAKLFYPNRNKRDTSIKYYAKKLHKLKDCKILIQYHTQEKILFKKLPTTVLISEYIEGPILSDYVKTIPKKKLTHFEALHFLHALVKGIEEIHLANEYHGDIHSDNIIVSKHGTSIEFKLVDLYSQNQSKRENQKQDILSLIHIFHEILGGAKNYSKHPSVIKKICCGLKSSLILKKFKTASQLRAHLETINWIEE